MPEFYDPESTLFSHPARFQAFGQLQSNQASVPTAQPIVTTSPSVFDRDMLLVLMFLAVLAFFALLLLIYFKPQQRRGED